MITMKEIVGRNSPCPCGSGKKYKKCCYNISSGALTASNTNPRIKTYSDIDFGQPKPDGSFFSRYNIAEISAQRLFYSCLLRPDIEGKASKITSTLISRGEQEQVVIKNTSSPESLVGILIDGIDIINFSMIAEKHIEYKEEAIPLLLKELKTNEEDQFIEYSLKIIHRSEVDCFETINELLMNTTNAYKASLLAIMLGVSENTKYTKILWDYFHYFKKKFPGTNYCDGPFLALSCLYE